MNKDEFVNALKEMNIILTDIQLNQLEKYYELLIVENKVQNLTRIVEKEDVYLKHFYDSLTIKKVIDLNNYKTLCDVGTGAGFPGIVLKIVYPNLNVTLIDSTLKKVTFLNKVIKELNLTNIVAICERIEDHKEKYDVVVLRAVGRLNILLELCLPIANNNGYFIAMKANVQEEIEASQKALKILNSEIEEINEFFLKNGANKRTLIKVIKLSSIDPMYPRKFDKITKNPL